MIQSKSRRLLKLAVATALIATPLVTSFDDTAKAKTFLDEVLGISQKADRGDMMSAPVLKDPLKVYLSDGEAVIHRESAVEKVIKDQFVFLDGTEKVEGRDVLVPVSSNFNKDLQIVVDASNSDTIRLYSKPNLKAELNATVRPDQKFVSSELDVYNGRFIKVKDQTNSTYYINLAEVAVDIKPVNGKNFRVAMGTNHRQVTDKTRNVTLDLQTPTNLTAEELRPLVAGTGLDGIEGAVVEIEEKYHINALFTIALAQIESGHGESYLATNRNNLFGIAAYDGNEGAATYFSSKSECVRQWGELIKKAYFDCGRTNPYTIGSKYASNPDWGSDVESQMSDLAQRL